VTVYGAKNKEKEYLIAGTDLSHIKVLYVI